MQIASSSILPYVDLAAVTEMRTAGLFLSIVIAVLLDSMETLDRIAGTSEQS